MNFSQFDLLGKNIDRNTPFFIGLLGAHGAIKRFFGFRDIPLPIIQNNNVKAVLRQGLDNPNDLKYPYAYMSLTEIELAKDRQAVKTIRRQSQGFNVNGTNATVSKFYGFPVSVGLELHFVTNDLLQAIQFSLKALTLLTTETLSFDVEDDNFAWMVQVSTDSNSISFPKSDKDNEADPEAFDMVCTIKVTGYSGVTKDVPKINNQANVGRRAGIINKAGEVIYDEE